MKPQITGSLRQKSLPLCLLLAFVAGYLWGATPAYAAPQIPPTDDTYVDWLNSDDNFDDNRLQTLFSSFGGTVTSTSDVLLQFDISIVTTPADESDVVLTIIRNVLGAATTFVTLGLYETSDGWDESTVTYAIAPPAGTLLQQITVNKEQTGEIRFDNAAVGAYIETQRTNNASIVSFRLRIDAANSSLPFDAGGLVFEDKENTGGTGNTPYLDKLPTPTIVDLVSFTAEPTGDSVTLRWETGDEIDNAGFNLYRADTETGQRTQVNDQLIAAAGNGAGAKYAYVDERPPGVYYYWLEDVDTAGNATLHGPVHATLGGAAAEQQQLFLPIIAH